MITAIETHYAGCHFRSRLEARWAVFFDTMKIKWEYEPQGYSVSRRLTDQGRFNYLPDFWLPEHGLHAEVKGSLSALECRRLLDAAASLSSNDGGGCQDAGGNDMVVLGPIPDPASARLPIRLHMHKGGLGAVPYNPLCHGVDCYGEDATAGGTNWLDHVEVANDGDDYTDVKPPTARGIADFLLAGWQNPQPSGPEYLRLREAYTAARAARFEFGQSGGRS